MCHHQVNAIILFMVFNFQPSCVRSFAASQPPVPPLLQLPLLMGVLSPARAFSSGACFRSCQWQFYRVSIFYLLFPYLEFGEAIIANEPLITKSDIDNLDFGLDYLDG